MKWFLWGAGALFAVIAVVVVGQLVVGAVWATDEHTAAASSICSDLAGTAPEQTIGWQGGLAPHWTCEWWDAAAGEGGSADIRWFEVIR